MTAAQQEGKFLIPNLKKIPSKFEKPIFNFSFSECSAT